nr:hypothetical protein [uncultured Ottowia sp.]
MGHRRHGQAVWNFNAVIEGERLEKVFHGGFGAEVAENSAFFRFAGRAVFRAAVQYPARRIVRFPVSNGQINGRTARSAP